MDRESIQNLRFDTRLRHRRGWVSTVDVEAELENLPDASDKIDRADPDAPTQPESQEA